MQITNSTQNDIDTILGLYEAAVAYQKTKFYKHWQGFDQQLIEKEIDENELPRGLKYLMEKSHNLYVRIQRLEEQYKTVHE